MIKPAVKSDILDVLRTSLKAIKENNLSLLREQSFRTVHNSSIYQDEYSISISVLIYSVFKVLEKNKFKQHKKWDDFKKILMFEIKQAINYLSKDEMKKYGDSLKKIISNLTKLDKSVGMYLDDVMKATKIKKASNIHSHGLSAGRAADLLGVSKWDLLPYFGQTKTYDIKDNISKSAKDRLVFARKVFGIK